MPRRKEIASDLRAQAVGLHRGGGSLGNIATMLSLPRSTVQSIIDRWKKTKSVYNNKRSGRPSLFTKRGMRKLKSIVKKNRWNTLRRITSEVQNDIGQSVSSSTVRRRLHDIGFSACIPARKPFISEKNRLKRLEFFSDFKNWGIEEWKDIIWSDESRFKLYHSDGRLKVWRQRNEKFLNECIRKTVKWDGGSIMIWGCFYNDTLGPCYLVNKTFKFQFLYRKYFKAFIYIHHFIWIL